VTQNRSKLKFLEDLTVYNGAPNPALRKSNTQTNESTVSTQLASGLRDQMDGDASFLAWNCDALVPQWKIMRETTLPQVNFLVVSFFEFAAPTSKPGEGNK